MARMETADYLEQLKDDFATTFGQRPEFCARAPGRVNVIGEHVDYNGGLVLPAAIERSMMAAVKPNGKREIAVSSGQMADVLKFSLETPQQPGETAWIKYIQGVVAQFEARGVEVPGFDATLFSTIPIGGGLSSSAALEAITGRIILQLLGEEMPLLELAKLCQAAEHEFAGVPCGLMDQAAVLMAKAGYLLKLDCRSEATEAVPFEAPEWKLLIINSMVSHELADGEYGKRRKACEDSARVLGVETLRELSLADLPDAMKHPGLNAEMRYCVHHVVTEIARTEEAIGVLGEGKISALGKLMNASHQSLSRDYRVSCAELDYIAETMQAMDEVAGCRMTGGGFGGCAIALVEAGAVDKVERTIQTAYEGRFSRSPMTFQTRPASGAEIV